MVHSVNLRESEIQMYPPNGLSIAHCPATLWKYVQVWLGSMSYELCHSSNPNLQDSQHP